MHRVGMSPVPKIHDPAATELQQRTEGGMESPVLVSLVVVVAFHVGIKTFDPLRRESDADSAVHRHLVIDSPGRPDRNDRSIALTTRNHISDPLGGQLWIMNTGDGTTVRSLKVDERARLLITEPVPREADSRVGEFPVRFEDLENPGLVTSADRYHDTTGHHHQASEHYPDSEKSNGLCNSQRHLCSLAQILHRRDYGRNSPPGPSR